MRVDYTLPALQPAISPDTQEIGGEGGASFREFLQGEVAPLPGTVDEQLRLDARPYTGTYIGAPPRPHTLGLQDADAQRQCWHGIVRKHFQNTGNLSRIGMGRGQPVYNMLEMLQDMQDMEDSIVAQAVALSRG